VVADDAVFTGIINLMFVGMVFVGNVVRSLKTRLGRRDGIGF
jgi:hypothetical protein